MDPPAALLSHPSATFRNHFSWTVSFVVGNSLRVDGVRSVRKQPVDSDREIPSAKSRQPNVGAERPRSAGQARSDKLCDLREMC
jgi:hypothetical protein